MGAASVEPAPSTVAETLLPLLALLELTAAPPLELLLLELLELEPHAAIPSATASVTAAAPIRRVRTLFSLVIDGQSLGAIDPRGVNEL
jgi:hypothetical protein